MLQIKNNPRLQIYEAYSISSPSRSPDYTFSFIGKVPSPDTNHHHQNPPVGLTSIPSENDLTPTSLPTPHTQSTPPLFLPPSKPTTYFLRTKAVPPPSPSFVLRTSDLARLRVVYQCTSSSVPLSVYVHLEGPPPLLPLRDFEFLDWKLEELPILYRSKG